MKVTIYVLLFALAVRSCPDEPLCRECETTEPVPYPCRLCDHGLQDPKTKKCIQASLTIDDCEVYALSPVNHKDHVCHKCKLGFFLIENACTKCQVDNCAECTKVDACSACFGGKKVAADGKSCTAEPATIEHCAVVRYWADKEEPECLECNKGFARVNHLHKCIATKKDNCLEVTDETKDECSLCAQGFFLAGKGECKANPNNGGKKSNIGTVLLILLLVGLIAAGGYYFVYHRKQSFRRPNEPLIN